MSNDDSGHLTEEQMADAASDVLTDEIREHLSVCDICAKEVKELKSVADAIKAIEDEDVPSSVERRIFHALHRNKPKITKILESPMLSILFAVIIIFLLYLMIGMLLVDQ
jgi:hypothetical protein